MNKNSKRADDPKPIQLRLEDGYIVASCGDQFRVAELIWERRHADSKTKLRLRLLESVPTQFEREAFRVTSGLGG